MQTEEDFTPISDEQLNAINRLLREIVGEATREQIEAAYRSVLSS